MYGYSFLEGFTLNIVVFFAPPLFRKIGSEESFIIYGRGSLVGALRGVLPYLVANILLLTAAWMASQKRWPAANQYSLLVLANIAGFCAALGAIFLFFWWGLSNASLLALL